MCSQEKRKEYDEEPVKYCTNCYSLKIKYEETIDSDCCANCGCLSIRESNIREWEKLYEKKYGKKFVEDTCNLKQSAYFNMPISKLKKKVFESKNFDTILKTLYPNFPGGYSKADSVILLFDKLSKDNKLDELRLLLLKLN